MNTGQDMTGSKWFRPSSWENSHWLGSQERLHTGNNIELGPGKGLDDGQLGQGPSMRNGTEWGKCILCIEEHVLSR